MKLVFIGSGYVGLVSGVMLSSLGHHVICIDNDKKKIDSLKNGEIPIYEPGLDKYLNQSISSGNLTFASSYSELQFSPDAVFITVGTPPLAAGNANLEYVKEAALEAIKNTHESTLIIIKSTVPPGTTRALTKLIREKGFNHEIVCNPEFLREGSAIEDFMQPDRVVIGVTSPVIARSAATKQSTGQCIAASSQGTPRNDDYVAIHKIYEHFTKNNYKILFTDTTTAELIKYASNSFLATKIAFINEMANLCEKTGGDIDMLSLGMGLDPRIGKDFLKVGPGFGGSCFPKDILALEYLADSHKEPCYVLSAVIESNKKRMIGIVDKIKNILMQLEGKKIAVLGLTFKAGTDDVRSSPAIDIIKLLVKNKVNISAYDPSGMHHAEKLNLGIKLAENYIEAATTADAILILTEWEEFKNLDYNILKEKMSGKIIFDFRNILDMAQVKNCGFQIYQLGKEMIGND